VEVVAVEPPVEGLSGLVVAGFERGELSRGRDRRHGSHLHPQTSLWQRLTSHAEQRWPQIQRISTRYRAGFAYIDAILADGDTLKLCRLRYGGSAHQWGFAIYRASHDDYEDSYLPSGYPVGTAEQALDTACGLYLGDPTAWI